MPVEVNIPVSAAADVLMRKAITTGMQNGSFILRGPWLCLKGQDGTVNLEVIDQSLFNAGRSPSSQRERSGDQWSHIIQYFPRLISAPYNRCPRADKQIDKQLEQLSHAEAVLHQNI
jgi:hypothetical protein